MYQSRHNAVDAQHLCMSLYVVGRNGFVCVYVELPHGAIGKSFASWLSENEPERIDPVIEIAITPNRGDAASVRGIARDLSVKGIGRLKPMPAYKQVAALHNGLFSISIAEDTQKQ